MNYSKSVIAKYATVALFLGVALLPVMRVVGFEQDNLLLTFDWSNNILFQDDSGNVTVLAESFCPFELRVTWIGIHFSWMDENNYYALDFSSNPLIIVNGSITSLGLIEFIILKDAVIGLNQYYVMIYYKENETENVASKTWISQTYEIQIHDYEKTYNETRPLILDSIKAVNYEVAAAKDLYALAVKEYNSSIILADQDLWKDAVACLLNSSHILAEASNIEIQHWRNQSFELINAIVHNTNEQAYECSEAESLFSQAHSQLIEAQSYFNIQTLDSYKQAFSTASEAKSIFDLASTKETIYSTKKQEATEKLNKANLSLNQTTTESTISRELLKEAGELLILSQDALLTKTTEGCESAFLYAEQALTKISQAIEADSNYQVQRQQQQYLVFAGSIAFGASVLYFFLAAKLKKGGVNTKFSSLLAHVSSNSSRNIKNEPLNGISKTSPKDKAQSANNIQGDEDPITKLIKQASNLC